MIEFYCLDLFALFLFPSEQLMLFFTISIQFGDHDRIYLGINIKIFFKKIYIYIYIYKDSVILSVFYIFNENINKYKEKETNLSLYLYAKYLSLTFDDVFSFYEVYF